MWNNEVTDRIYIFERYPCEITKLPIEPIFQKDIHVKLRSYQYNLYFSKISMWNNEVTNITFILERYPCEITKLPIEFIF